MRESRFPPFVVVAAASFSGCTVDRLRARHRTIAAAAAPRNRTNGRRARSAGSDRAMSTSRKTKQTPFGFGDGRSSSPLGWWKRVRAIGSLPLLSRHVLSLEIEPLGQGGEDELVHHHAAPVRDGRSHQPRDDPAKEPTVSEVVPQEVEGRLRGVLPGLSLRLDDVGGPHRQPREVGADRALRERGQTPTILRHQRSRDVPAPAELLGRVDVDHEGRVQDGVARQGHARPVEDLPDAPAVLDLPPRFEEIGGHLHQTPRQASGGPGDDDLPVEDAEQARRGLSAARVLLEPRFDRSRDAELGRTHEGAAHEEGHAAPVEPRHTLLREQVPRHLEPARSRGARHALHPDLDGVERLADDHGGQTVRGSRDERREVLGHIVGAMLCDAMRAAATAVVVVVVVVSAGEPVCVCV
mmetsp:Transcript_24828/g.58253  ORF Transcript_24828/g.58253 Transcript_24828/m.58253 type:complete len:411 (+) Transcript_24828:106-1338(+)